MVRRRRGTEDNASSEDFRQTSGGVFVAVDSDLGAVVDKEEWAVMSIFWERRKNRPSMGERPRRYAFFFLPCAFGTQKDGLQGMRR